MVKPSAWSALVTWPASPLRPTPFSTVTVICEGGTVTRATVAGADVLVVPGEGGG